MALTDLNRICFDVEMTNPSGDVAELVRLVKDIENIESSWLADYTDEKVEELECQVSELEETIDSLEDKIAELEDTITQLKEK